MSRIPPVRFLHGYVHHGRIATIVEVGCDSETLVAMGDFRALVGDLALQIAAQNPPNIEALLNASFLKDNSVTVRALIANASNHFKESIVVTRFVRWSSDDDLQRPETPDPKDPAAAMRHRA